MPPIVKRLPLLAAALALPLSALPLAAHAAPAQKIGMAKAKAIALKAAPGKIVESDFEKENGGWRYSFDIRQGKRITRSASMPTPARSSRAATKSRRKD